MERKIEIMRPAFHKIDPDPKKNYGVGSVQMRFVLLGDAGAITWTIITGWHLPETYDWWEAQGIKHEARDAAMGAAVCIHSPTQMFDFDKEPVDCDVLPGGKCFGDCGFLAGETFFNALVHEGEEAVWKLMEEWYTDHLPTASS